MMLADEPPCFPTVSLDADNNSCPGGILQMTLELAALLRILLE
jgi:hypothetical protein